MGLLMLLATALFAIAQSALQVSSDLQNIQKREITVERFMDFCQRQWRALPAEAKIRLEVAEESQDPISTLSIRNPGLGFSWGKNQPEVALLLPRKQARGSYNLVLAHATPREINRLMKGGEAATQLPFLEEIKQLRWRLYDTRRNQWQVAWKENQGRPQMAELELEFYGDPEIRRAVFWIPPARSAELAIIQLTLRQLENNFQEDQELNENLEENVQIDDIPLP